MAPPANLHRWAMGIPSRARRPVPYATPSLPIPGLLTIAARPSPPRPSPLTRCRKIPRRRCSKHHRPAPSWGIRDTSGGFPSQTASAGYVPEVDKAAAYTEEEGNEREWLPVPYDDDLRGLLHCSWSGLVKKSLTRPKAVQLPHICWHIYIELFCLQAFCCLYREAMIRS
jgi:hypothetical protein